METNLPSKTDCIYTSFYCEENVWKLCEKLQHDNYCKLKDLYAVFITTDLNQTPLWYQTKGTGPENFVVWDYHVILVQKDNPSLVLDFDTVLDFPCNFQSYITKAIREESNFKNEHKRKFRVISAMTYLTSFASDRSHMIKNNGQFQSEPPSYPPIVCSGSTNNIEEFISMDPNKGIGQVFNLEDFIHFLN